MEEYHPSYSSLENYGKSVLEFILKKYGIAKQKTWEHDSIFNFASDIKIDWKVINKKTGNASITSKDKKGNTNTIFKMELIPKFLKALDKKKNK